MNRILFVIALFVPSLNAATDEKATLHGTITDPSGANVPNALIQLRGQGTEQRARSNETGQYSFAAVPPGKYLVRVIAKGFSVAQRPDFEIAGAALLDIQLTIEMQAQVMNVEDEANRLTADPETSVGTIVMQEKQLATLSDDPDELEQQLQALAGPGAGPNGGQIYIDGFTGGNMPPKSSIREVRINSNPYSPEYDRPGFGRIEILTKPGSDTLRGQAFFQFNNEALNSRSPLLTQSNTPPYQQRFFGFSLSGPVKKQKASFGFDFERRNIDENAFVLATTLDSNLNPVEVNRAVVTPQVRTNLSPRLDLTLNAKNTLVVRYQNVRSELDREGIGNYSLPSRAYDQASTENGVQLTETAVLSPKAINEARFQFMRTNLSHSSASSDPALSVVGAFENGGAQIGNSGTMSNRWELSNITTLTQGTHIWKWGARLRQSFIDDTSVNNFIGTYSFFGGTGPELDANSQAIAGTSIQLSALEVYRRTLLFQGLGYSADLIRILGGGASQFSLGAGEPTTSISQVDAGLFVNDDWKLRPSFTLSYGLRYETQNNIHDWSNFAPRVGIAWGIGRGPTKTVLRAGYGIFFDRVSESTTLQSLRYNGTTQQSYLVLNPDFFPLIPTAETLAAYRQPQQLQIVDSSIKAPRTYQASVSVDRQINSYVRFSAQYLNIRGQHLLRTRNINAPIDGVYPFGDSQFRLLTESTGRSQSNMFILSPNVNYKKITLFGFYAFSHGKTDAEGTAADPYNLRAEWGPSSFADVRHRVVIGTNLPMPWKISISPFLMASSGVPYNVVTGLDINGDGFTSERPELLTSVAAAACTGGTLVYEPGYGCFDLNPAAGTAIGRNAYRGPANVNLNLRMARTWSFGTRGESGTTDSGGPPPGGGGMRGGPGGGGPPPGGGGPPPGGGPGGPGGPGGMFSSASGRKYNLTLSVSARNIINHANYSSPSGDLSSSYFGEYRSLAGFGPFGASTTYNRKIDLQLRFTF